MLCVLRNTHSRVLFFNSQCFNLQLHAFNRTLLAM
jgi:hypothetical protein